MNSIPAHLQDAAERLSAQGFAVDDVWYHGTSSALLPAIMEQGLKGSGDRALREAEQQTMSTIGGRPTEQSEPVFLTQSKALAWYWANQKVRQRRARFGDDEAPVVVAASLPAALRAEIKPDVGAASLLLLPDGEQYLAFVAGLYEAASRPVPAIDLRRAERMDYLNKLGMAYCRRDIAADCLQLCEA